MSLISAAIGGLAWTASEYAIHRFIGHGPKRALKASGCPPVENSENVPNR